MADRFETRLERLFAEPPYFADADAFAGTTQARLGRGQATRSLMIAGAGVIGGVVAVAQVLNANLGAAVEGAGVAAAPLNAGLSQPLTNARVSGLLDQLAPYLPTSSTGMEVVWTGAALVLAGMALLAARVIGERG